MPLKRPANTLPGSIAMSLCIIVGVPGPAQENKTALPFAGTDVVTVIEDDGRQRTLPGQIEDIEGNTLTFRQSGLGNILFLRLSDVLELDFTRSPEWEQGLREREDGELQQALQQFDQALRKERREWAWIELQATAAGVLIRLGQRQKAVERIEEILKRDERSRHVLLLPVVWDERLPEESRITATGADLKSKSVLLRLVAASALLHDSSYQDSAKTTLQKIRRDSRQGPLADLAETQLWRMALLDRSGKTQMLGIWRDRVRSIDATGRHGPLFILGRCFQKQHRHDNAAVAFLWAGLMSPTDNALAAQALTEAVVSLNASGQVEEATRIHFELKQRYPEFTAAQNVREH